MTFLMYLGFTLVTSCSAAVSAQNTFDAEKESFEILKQNATNEWRLHKAIEEDTWNEYKSKVTKKWQDGQMPSVKNYVEYSEDFLTRIKVDFENGRVNLETISEQKLSNDQIKDKFEKIINRNMNLLKDQIQSNKKFKIAGGTVEFNSLVATAQKPKVYGDDGISRSFYKVSLSMVPSHVRLRAHNYLPSVLLWASRYSLPPALILAIIWQESSFNPLARSHIPAFGLMQIVPRYAGADVKKILNEAGNVDGDFLYNSDNNLRYGTTYLKILSENNFKDIEPFEKRVPFIIASYNWGPSKLVKSLKRGSIDLSSARKIKEQIIKIAPSETKLYLEKVIERWKKIESENWLNVSKT